ncbi:MAG: hypothetical protein N2049_11615 [Anaerolineales bacterium]|nr:hypothetical protein [Anaerolineales bacterium]MCX7609846.1 hypothetical protein [Anaerolineales bacterium]MDW8227321.1 hypothetical protein [Anaerolineales bacterium]
MLIIISDLHLTDGTCGQSISPAAFRLFVDRLRELVQRASHRKGGRYHPLEEVNIVLLGDILDVQHSTLWLKHKDGAPTSIRPWSEVHEPEFIRTVDEITEDILKHNERSIRLLKNLTTTGAFLSLPPANREGQPARFALRSVPVRVNLYYMVGNHDWFYHLSGKEFERIRDKVRQALGLANPPGPFPHQSFELTPLDTTLQAHGVYAQHGDLYDDFNYDHRYGRDHAALGDAFAVEVINRFPVRVEEEMKDAIPPALVTALRELVNVRPALAAPLWISGQLQQNNVELSIQKRLKAIWNDLGSDFLKNPFVREYDRLLKLDVVDGLEALFGLTSVISFEDLNKLVLWIRKRFWREGLTLAQHALREKAFLNKTAQYIVYGHSHHHEVVPLDYVRTASGMSSQMYLNSGTWHTYFDLAIHKPKEQKFIPYQVLSYLVFYREDEHQGRRYETWSSSFAE